MWAATEMGDTELAQRLAADAEEMLEPVLEGGVKHYAKASTLSNAGLLGAQVGIVGSHQERVARGIPREQMDGPVLADCAYPDVLVARAVSDGSDLRLVLRPGNGAARQALRIDRLRPGRAYDVAGAVDGALTADASGSAFVDVVLDGRTEVQIAPRS
jgi:hypothetical protein